MLHKIENFIARTFVYAVLLFGGPVFFLLGDSSFEQEYPLLGFLARIIAGIALVAIGVLIFVTPIVSSLILGRLIGFVGIALFIFGAFVLKKVFTYNLL